jgi:hypothetical protein
VKAKLESNTPFIEVDNWIQPTTLRIVAFAVILLQTELAGIFGWVFSLLTGRAGTSFNALLIVQCQNQYSSGVYCYGECQWLARHYRLFSRFATSDYIQAQESESETFS